MRAPIVEALGGYLGAGPPGRHRSPTARVMVDQLVGRRWLPRPRRVASSRWCVPTASDHSPTSRHADGRPLPKCVDVVRNSRCGSRWGLSAALLSDPQRGLHKPCAPQVCCQRRVKPRAMWVRPLGRRVSAWRHVVDRLHSCVAERLLARRALLVPAPWADSRGTRVGGIHAWSGWAVLVCVCVAPRGYCGEPCRLPDSWECGVLHMLGRALCSLLSLVSKRARRFVAELLCVTWLLRRPVVRHMLGPFRPKMASIVSGRAPKHAIQESKRSPCPTGGGSCWTQSRAAMCSQRCSPTAGSSWRAIGIGRCP